MRLGALTAILCFGAICSAAAPDPIKLSGKVREKCLTVLRDGLKSDEFWPSIHAAEGLTSAQIAERLFISPRTAETHRANLMRKLSLRSQTDLVRYAIRKKIIEA